MKKLLTVCLLIVMMISVCTVFIITDVSADGIVELPQFFSDRDLSGSWDTETAVYLDLDAYEEDIVLDAAGTYVLFGTLAGTVVVNTGDQDKVQLVLKGAEICAEGTAAILVENADKTFITLDEGSENVISVSGLTEKTDVDAALFARDDLTMNGMGSLTVISDKHGIAGKDDVKITGGKYVLRAEGRGIDANDSVRICGGEIDIISGRDGIRAENEDDTAKGYVLLAGGVLSVNAGGGSAMGGTRTEMNLPGFRGGWGIWDNETEQETDKPSMKGIRAGGWITIGNCSITVDAADDAVHSDTELTVYDGMLRLSSGDDGMHADEALTLNGGTVEILSSYEGLEAARITINGGNINVNAFDDGVNSSCGNDQGGIGRKDMFFSDGSSITINGGSLYVSPEGDGLDSNGDLMVNGGTVTVSGPVNNGNGALDYNGIGAVNGGTVIAAGAAGMAVCFDSTSEQVSALAVLDGSAGQITVTDELGCMLLNGELEKSFQCVVISSPELQLGRVYTIMSGGESAQVRIDGITNGGLGFGSGRMIKNSCIENMRDERHPPQVVPGLPHDCMQMPGRMPQVQDNDRQMPGSGIWEPENSGILPESQNEDCNGIGQGE